MLSASPAMELAADNTDSGYAEVTVLSEEVGSSHAGNAGLSSNANTSLPKKVPDPAGPPQATATTSEFGGSVNEAPELSMWIDHVDGTNVMIAGEVFDDSPGPYTVTFSGAASGSTVTDEAGYFEVTLQASELGAIDGVAQDSGGLESEVYTVWVESYEPFVDIWISDLDERTVTISGTVDDENPEQTPVEISGIISGTVTPNADGTFSFTAEASSPGEILVIATDVWGQQSEVAVAELTNVAPEIDEFWGTELTGNEWEFSGVVLDEDPEGMIVTFGGLLEGYTATVNYDGTFSLIVELDPNASGLVTAITTDWWGVGSEEETWLVS